MTTSIETIIKNAFDHRVAIRRYTDQEISKEDMELILDSAWLSPSSIGLEAWRFLVLDRKAIAKLKDELAPVAWGAGPQLETASHFVILLARKDVRYDTDNIKESLVRRGLDDEMVRQRLIGYENFQKNDMTIADDDRLLWEWAAKQTYIALANMMTTASLLNLDSCPIEGFNYAKVNDILAKHKLINPDIEAIASMVSFGYRANDPKHPRQRKDRKDVITWAELD